MTSKEIALILYAVGYSGMIVMIVIIFIKSKRVKVSETVIETLKDKIE